MARKKKEIETEISIDLSQVVEALLLRSEEEALFELEAQQMNPKQAKSAIDAAKKALANTRTPTKAEIIAMNKLIFAKAIESNSLGIAQKTVQELARISRIEHQVDIELPSEATTKAEMVKFLLANINAIGPSNMTALARLLGGYQVEQPKQEEVEVNDDTPIESKQDAIEKVLKIINGGKK
jgi:hypothetical protein